MEQEVNGLNYRYVYGNERLQVRVTPVENAAGSIQEGSEVNLYYHIDRLGTYDYLTSASVSRVISWTSYNEWGEITHNAVLKCGVRELDMVKNYTGHEYDSVLDLYYAKARMYDAQDRRFMAVDSLKGYIDIPQSLVQYTYCLNNPLKYTDPTGCDGGPWRENMGLVGPYDTAQNDITQIIQNATKHVTDPVRADDLWLGFLAGLAKGLIDAGPISLAVALDILNASAVQGGNGLPTMQITLDYYNTYLKNSNALVSYYANQTTYPDSFYLGKMLGDATLMGVGLGLGVEGIFKAIGGTAAGAGGIMLSGGVALAPSLAIAGTAVASAAVDFGAGAALFAAGSGNFGGNKASYDYYAKLQCIKDQLKDGMIVSTDQALDLVEGFLGSGYNEVAPGFFRSKDGLRQVRMTDSDLAPVNNHAGAAHINFETGTLQPRANGSGMTFKARENIHVYVLD